MNIEEALARTALLVKLDVFPQLDEQRIVQGLTNMRVRLAADAATASCAAGQTALTAALIAVAQLGARVDLALPDAELIRPQPPLRGRELGPALIDLAEDLMLAASTDGGLVDLAFVFGDASPGDARDVMYVYVDDWGATLDESPMPATSGTLPFGGLLAAAAIGAESLRGALNGLAAATGSPPLGEHRLERPPQVTLRLPPLPAGALDLGAVDVISAGAITNAALFALLRWPGLRGRLRVVDDDIAAESNLNRYALLRRKHLGRAKVDLLHSYSTAELEIVPIERRLTEATLDDLAPLSPRILVGVDDIPSRWLVARHAPGWVCVAGTTHFTVLVSEHEPGGPCAGCLHPRDDPGDGDIPTASFVSQLAGTLQAYRLLANSYRVPPARPVLAAAFNLGAPRALISIGMPPRADCPVGCAASRRLNASHT
jgi:molybdopterin/thiamine biosynthesis adenylyltransferase